VVDVSGIVVCFYFYFLFVSGFSHNADNIAQAVTAAFVKWDLSRKILYCTTDTTSKFACTLLSVYVKQLFVDVMPAAVQKIGAKWIPCGDHIINIVATAFEKSTRQREAYMQTYLWCLLYNTKFFGKDPISQKQQ
jgi:hypothetical protein